MIEADLIVEGIGELVTCAGSAPLTGPSMKSTGVIHDALVGCCDGKFVAAGQKREIGDTLRLRPDGRKIHAGGRTVLPGFVDPHTHLAFGGNSMGRLRQRRRAVMASIWTRNSSSSRSSERLTDLSPWTLSLRSSEPTSCLPSIVRAGKATYRSLRNV